MHSIKLFKRCFHNICVRENKFNNKMDGPARPQRPEPLNVHACNASEQCQEEGGGGTFLPAGRIAAVAA